LLEQRSKHAEPGIALPLVVERGPRDFEHETLLAGGVNRILAALSPHDRLKQHGFIPRDTCRTAQIDDFRRPQVELVGRQVPLPHDGAQAAADCGMIGGRTDLGSAGIRKETHFVGGRQTIDELLCRGDHVTRRARVKAQTIDGDEDDTRQRRFDGRSGDRDGTLLRGEARRAPALDELRRQDAAPAPVDRHLELVGTKPGHRRAVAIDDLYIDSDHVEPGSERRGRLLALRLLAGAKEGCRAKRQHADRERQSSSHGLSSKAR
jgi:hypothetical protein